MPFFGDDDEILVCPKCKLFIKRERMTEHILQCEEDRKLAEKFIRLAGAHLMKMESSVSVSSEQPEAVAPAKKEKKVALTKFEAAKLRLDRKKKKAAATTYVVSQKTGASSVGDPDIDKALANIELRETGKAPGMVRDRNTSRAVVYRKNKADAEAIGDVKNSEKAEPEVEEKKGDSAIETGNTLRDVKDSNKTEPEVDRASGSSAMETGRAQGSVCERNGNSGGVVYGGRARERQREGNGCSERGIVITGQQGATQRGTSKIKGDSKGKEKVVDELFLKKREQKELQTAIVNSKNNLSGQKRFLFGEGSSTDNFAEADGKTGGDLDSVVLKEVRDRKPKANVDGCCNVGKRTARDFKIVRGGGVELQYSSKDQRKSKEVGVNVVADGQDSDEKLQKEAAEKASCEKKEKVDCLNEIGGRISEYWRDAGEEDPELKMWLSFKINDPLLKIWREAGGDIY